MKLVDDDYDTGSYFVVDENGEGCGGRLIEDELWARYEAAERIVEDIKAEIDACQFVHCPPPKEGTLARMMYDYYQDEARRMLANWKPYYQPKAADEDD